MRWRFVAGVGGGEPARVLFQGRRQVVRLHVRAAARRPAAVADQVRPEIRTKAVTDIPLHLFLLNSCLVLIMKYQVRPEEVPRLCDGGEPDTRERAEATLQVRSEWQGVLTRVRGVRRIHVHF
jgi:hypothetical protein